MSVFNPALGKADFSGAVVCTSKIQGAVSPRKPG